MSEEQMRPASKEKAPDPADVYERAHPEHESGMGRLDNNKAVPTPRCDGIKSGVVNEQNPTHQLNAEDVINQRGTARPPAKAAGE
jgi:hypothetical protein